MRQSFFYAHNINFLFNGLFHFQYVIPRLAEQAVGIRSLYGDYGLPRRAFALLAMTSLF